ncbi:N-acetyltransferase, partial [Filobacillus milosensis]
MLKISTDRLIIRDHIEEDLYPMHELLSSRKEMYYLPELRTTSIEVINQNLQVAINESKTNKRSKFFFAIIDKNTGDYIGEIGFIRKSKSIFGDIMELGY